MVNDSKLEKEQVFTGIRLDVELKREFKAKCADRGVTLKGCIEEFMRRYIETPDGSADISMGGASDLSRD